LFPHSLKLPVAPVDLGRYRRERRVAHPDLLRLYFERALPTDRLHSAELELIATSMGDEKKFSDFLRTAPEEKFYALIYALPEVAEHIPPEAMTSAIPLLLGYLHEKGGEARTVVGSLEMRIALRSIVERALTADASQLTLVKETLSKLRNLSSQRELIDLCRDTDDGTVQETFAELDKEVLERLFLTPAEALAQEPCLAPLLLDALVLAGDSRDSKIGWFREQCQKVPGVAWQLLASGYVEHKVVSANATRIVPTFNWDWMLEVLDEDELRRLVESPPPYARQEVVDLAKRFLRGEQPPDIPSLLRRDFDVDRIRAALGSQVYAKRQRALTALEALIAAGNQPSGVEPQLKALASLAKYSSEERQKAIVVWCRLQGERVVRQALAPAWFQETDAALVQCISALYNADADGFESLLHLLLSVPAAQGKASVANFFLIAWRSSSVRSAKTRSNSASRLLPMIRSSGSRPS